MIFTMLICVLPFCKERLMTIFAMLFVNYLLKLVTLLTLQLGSRDPHTVLTMHLVVGGISLTKRCVNMVWYLLVQTVVAMFYIVPKPPNPRNKFRVSERMSEAWIQKIWKGLWTTC